MFAASKKRSRQLPVIGLILTALIWTACGRSRDPVVKQYDAEPSVSGKFEGSMEPTVPDSYYSSLPREQRIKGSGENQVIVGELGTTNPSYEYAKETRTVRFRSQVAVQNGRTFGVDLLAEIGEHGWGVLFPVQKVDYKVRGHAFCMNAVRGKYYCDSLVVDLIVEVNGERLKAQVRTKNKVGKDGRPIKDEEIMIDEDSLPPGAEVVEVDENGKTTDGETIVSDDDEEHEPESVAGEMMGLPNLVQPTMAKDAPQNLQDRLKDHEEAIRAQPSTSDTPENEESTSGNGKTPATGQTAQTPPGKQNEKTNDATAGNSSPPSSGSGSGSEVTTGVSGTHVDSGGVPSATPSVGPSVEPSIVPTPQTPAPRPPSTTTPASPGVPATNSAATPPKSSVGFLEPLPDDSTVAPDADVEMTNDSSSSGTNAAELLPATTVSTSDDHATKPENKIDPNEIDSIVATTENDVVETSISESEDFVKDLPQIPLPPPPAFSESRPPGPFQNVQAGSSSTAKQPESQKADFSNVIGSTSTSAPATHTKSKSATPISPATPAASLSNQSATTAQKPAPTAAPAPVTSTQLAPATAQTMPKPSVKKPVQPVHNVKSEPAPIAPPATSAPAATFDSRMIDTTTVFDMSQYRGTIQTPRNQAHGCYGDLYRTKQGLKPCPEKRILMTPSQLELSSPFYVLLAPERRRYFGTHILVEFLSRLSRVAQLLVPNYRLQIGDLGQKNGGKILKTDKKGRFIRNRKTKGFVLAHTSHQNGLDADVMYLAPGIYGFKPIVRGSAFVPQLRKREQWELFKKAIKTGVVSQILVGNQVKRNYCNYAKEIGEYESEQQTLRLLNNTAGHEDHFHVRLKCTSDNVRCYDEFPAQVNECDGRRRAAPKQAPRKRRRR